jgi:hypothetical protein
MSAGGRLIAVLPCGRSGHTPVLQIPLALSVSAREDGEDDEKPNSRVGDSRSSVVGRALGESAAECDIDSWWQNVLNDCDAQGGEAWRDE